MEGALFLIWRLPLTPLSALLYSCGAFYKHPSFVLLCLHSFILSSVICGYGKLSSLRFHYGVKHFSLLRITPLSPFPHFSWVPSYYAITFYSSLNICMHCTSPISPQMEFALHAAGRIREYAGHIATYTHTLRQPRQQEGSWPLYAALWPCLYRQRYNYIAHCFLPHCVPCPAHTPITVRICMPFIYAAATVPGYLLLLPFPYHL